MQCDFFIIKLHSCTPYHTVRCNALIPFMSDFGWFMCNHAV